MPLLEDDASLLMPQTISVAGMDIASTDLAGAVDAVAYLVATGNRHMVVTLNVDHSVRLHDDAQFAAAYRMSSICFADGMPIVWLSQAMKTPLPTRVTGADLMPAVSERAAELGWRVAIVGGGDGVAAEAAHRMQSRMPGLDVVLTACPPRGFEADPAKTQELIDELAAAEPDLIFLCLGSPKQERWAADNWADLTKSTIICVGAAVDFEAGVVRRAPEAVRKVGAEWVYRLVLEPGRLWRRYLVRGPRFAKIVLRDLKRARRERRASR